MRKWEHVTDIMVLVNAWEQARKTFGLLSEEAAELSKEIQLRTTTELQQKVLDAAKEQLFARLSYFTTPYSTIPGDKRWYNWSGATEKLHKAVLNMLGLQEKPK